MLRNIPSRIAALRPRVISRALLRPTRRVALAAGFAAAAAGGSSVVFAQSAGKQAEKRPSAKAQQSEQNPKDSSSAAAESGSSLVKVRDEPFELPRQGAVFLDVFQDHCVPCQMHAVVLEEVAHGLVNTPATRFLAQLAALRSNQPFLLSRCMRAIRLHRERNSHGNHKQPKTPAVTDL